MAKDAQKIKEEAAHTRDGNNCEIIPKKNKCLPNGELRSVSAQ